MVEYGYFNEGGYLVSKILEDRTERQLNEQGEPEEITITIAEQVENLINLGWKPVDLVDETKLTANSEFGSIKIQPYDNGDRISYHYIETFSKKLLINEIDNLKNKLKETDYRVTKCYEATLLNQVLPYNIEQLHSERETWRSDINRLEALL